MYRRISARTRAVDATCGTQKRMVIHTPNHSDTPETCISYSQGRSRTTATSAISKPEELLAYMKYFIVFMIMAII